MNADARLAPTVSTSLSLKPALVLETELSEPIPPIDSRRMTGRQYERSVVLVRLHTRAIGRVELPLEDGCIDSAASTRFIWAALGSEIAQHLADEGLPSVNGLDTRGLPLTGTPSCLLERAHLLTQAPHVTVVVATHNRPQGLAACLMSLAAMDYPRFDVVVVDNAPADDAAVHVVAEMREHGLPVRYVREPRPGLACAHNRGMQEVEAPLVAFTDDDVQVDRNWLTELVRGFNAAPDVGCVSGMIWPAELETPAQIWIENATGFSKGFVRKLFNLRGQQGSNALFPYAAGAFGSGANMAFRTEVLRAMRGFDPALGAGSAAMGGDDLAAFFNVIAGGHTLIYEPAALIRHWHRRDYAALQRQAYGYGVGLTAYLTSVLADNPRWLLDFAGRLPFGLAYALGERSPMNVRKSGGYPAELKRMERQGMLYGPLAYLNSRWRYRRVPRLQAGPGLASTSDLIGAA